MARSNVQTQSVGKGITVTHEGDDVVIRFSAKGDYGPSKSGKTQIVATTSGNVTLPSGVIIGVNAYRNTKG